MFRYILNDFISVNLNTEALLRIKDFQTDRCQSNLHVMLKQ